MVNRPRGWRYRLAVDCPSAVGAVLWTSWCSGRIWFDACFTIIYGVAVRFHSVENPLFPNDPYVIQAWYGVSGTLLFLSVFSSLAIAQLIRGLERSLVDLEAPRQHLAEADFNNLLLPILMGSEEARDMAPAGSLQRQCLDTVIISAERASNLVRRILNVSHHSTVDPRPMPVAPVLQEGVALLRSSTPANIDIHCEINADEACILADPDSFNQIVMNLGTNACLAMKARGGTLRLRLCRLAGKNQIQLDVEDTGAGIPLEIQDRILDPFFTTRESGSGTGLGLSIVHRLVTAMAGTISLHSEPGSGTRFSLLFDEVPAVTDLYAASSQSVDEELKPQRRMRVLIVDDEEMVRATLRNTLVREGYEVVDTGSPTFALQQLQEVPAFVDR